MKNKKWFFLFATIWLIPIFSLADIDWNYWFIFKVKITEIDGKVINGYTMGSEFLAKSDGNEILKDLQTKFNGPDYKKYLIFTHEGSLRCFLNLEKVCAPVNFYVTKEEKFTEVKISNIKQIQNLGFICEGLLDYGYPTQVISLLKNKPRFVIGPDWLKKTQNQKIIVQVWPTPTIGPEKMESNKNTPEIVSAMPTLPCPENDEDDDDGGGWFEEFLIYNPDITTDVSQNYCDSYMNNDFVKSFTVKCQFVEKGNIHSWEDLMNYEDQRLLKLGIVVLHVEQGPYFSAFTNPLYRDY